MKPRPVFVTLAALLIALVAIAGGGLLWWWAADDWKVARLNATLNYGLFVGAGFAAAGLFWQISEVRRARADGLRPVLIVTEAYPDRGALDDRTEIGPGRLVVRNIGPGPALEVEVAVWVGGPLHADGLWSDDHRALLEREGRELLKGSGPHLGYPWALNLAAGTSVSVPVWASVGSNTPGLEPGDSLRVRLTYSDVFGHRFVQSPLGHVWVQDEMINDTYGDHELHFS